MNFKKKILLLWLIFALLDPDPDSGFGSTEPIESGSGSATLGKTVRILTYFLKTQISEEFKGS
jgi:hypothetical protein